MTITRETERRLEQGVKQEEYLRVLRAVAARRGTITFGELSKALGFKRYRGQGPMLAKIRMGELAADRPDLSILVIRADNRCPASIDGVRVKDPTVEQKANAQRQQQEVWDFYERAGHE